MTIGRSSLRVLLFLPILVLSTVSCSTVRGEPKEYFDAGSLGYNTNSVEKAQAQTSFRLVLPLKFQLESIYKKQIILEDINGSLKNDPTDSKEPTLVHVTYAAKNKKPTVWVRQSNIQGPALKNLIDLNEESQTKSYFVGSIEIKHSDAVFPNQQRFQFDCNGIRIWVTLFYSAYEDSKKVIEVLATSC